MTEKQKKEILELGLKETNILFNENMAKHTTFKVGGEAECFIKIDNMKDLRTVLVYARNQ